ncbi:MAG: acylphosphatase [Microgenomates group bacterium]|jgi:acylphosphatase|nr:acylphosphatase [Microgenomates group bacterium]
MLKQVHIYIKGDVIGVGFRAWTKIQAKILGVNGWVKNNYDRPDVFGGAGGVEAVIQGEEEKINQMINLLKKGPPVARVDDIDVFWQEPKEIFEGFEIKK